MRPEKTFVVPAFTEKIGTELFPLIVKKFAPGPLILMLLAIGGKGAARVIVPVTVKSIVLLPGAELA